MGKVLHVWLARVIACVAALSLPPCVMAQRGPVSSSEFGGGGRAVYKPQDEPDEPSRTTSRSRSRGIRSLVRLGIWGIAGAGSVAGGVAAKNRKSKHTDGRARGVAKSTVPPGSTRFR